MFTEACCEMEVWFEKVLVFYSYLLDTLQQNERNQLIVPAREE